LASFYVTAVCRDVLVQCEMEFPGFELSSKCPNFRQRKIFTYLFHRSLS